MTGRVPNDRTTRFIRLVTVIAGASFAVFGLWAYLAPRSFFDTLATFEPYNVHLVRDIGAFQLGLGAVLLLSLLRSSTAGVVLGGAGIGAAFHALGHVIDRDLGGSPVTDIPTFAGLAIVLLATAWVAHSRSTDLVDDGPASGSDTQNDTVIGASDDR